MPRVMRRTPLSEEASRYDYGDFLKDVISKIATGATSNVQRMTSGELGNEELLEMAMAPAGGMLKIAGTGKLLAGLLGRRQAFRKAITYSGDINHIVKERFSRSAQVFKEALKVPEKEYGRLKDIGWGSMAGQQLGTKGLYDPWSKKVSLHPTLADAETVWHEFTHSRQYNPEYMSPMPGQGKGGTLEATYAQSLRELQALLLDASRASGMSASDFYYKVSPVEKHARGVAKVVREYPREFDAIYKTGLKSEVNYSREILHDLLKKMDASTKGMRLDELERQRINKIELGKMFPPKGVD